MARKSCYNRTGYLEDDRNYQESFLVATEVIPDRARAGYMDSFPLEAIQEPPPYDEYASDAGSDSGYEEEPLTPPGKEPEVSSDAYSPSFVDADEEAPFPDDWEEDPEELDLDYLAGGDWTGVRRDGNEAGIWGAR